MKENNFQKNYQICTKCIMDTTDPDIKFDEKGICSHCYRYENIINNELYRKKKDKGALEELIKEIKESGRDNKYDCIIGVSGGVDSTYVIYMAKKMGLKPLAVHMDNGWNSELSVDNINKALKTLGVDLYTLVLDWEEFKDLQLSFLKSSTPDIEIPTDHALRSVLYYVAAKENIRIIISGRNTATEGGGVAAWSQGHGDWLYIQSIQRLFGIKKLKTFPHYNLAKFFYYTVIKKIKWIQFLDYLEYNKKEAIEVLQKELGWRVYGGKHYESIYTRFYQGYILPEKFGFHKKRLHLSSLIWSDQISREGAINEMEKNDYPDDIQKQDREFVVKKLGISQEEFNNIMEQPPKTFWDYPSYKKTFYKHKLIIKISHFLQRS